jgi:bifunctional DNA-binding transcriptional regulator/antitoxin component of YhaV-PrlF toxin-antitoxin module
MSISKIWHINKSTVCTIPKEVLRISGISRGEIVEVKSINKGEIIIQSSDFKQKESR